MAKSGTIVRPPCPDCGSEHVVVRSHEFGRTRWKCKGCHGIFKTTPGGKLISTEGSQTNGWHKLSALKRQGERNQKTEPDPCLRGKKHLTVFSETPEDVDGEKRFVGRCRHCGRVANCPVDIVLDELHGQYQKIPGDIDQHGWRGQYAETG